MYTFIHKVRYYETDAMGITHHSNYIRWMEEARMDFLQSIGYGMKKLESTGISSPVISLECKYKHITTFDDEIKIEIKLTRYTGAQLDIHYHMTNLKTGALIATATSSHCFINKEGQPIAVRKYLPEFDSVLKSAIGKG